MRRHLLVLPCVAATVLVLPQPAAAQEAFLSGRRGYEDLYVEAYAVWH